MSTTVSPSNQQAASHTEGSKVGVGSVSPKRNTIIHYCDWFPLEHRQPRATLRGTSDDHFVLIGIVAPVLEYDVLTHFEDHTELIEFGDDFGCSMKRRDKMKTLRGY